VLRKDSLVATGYKYSIKILGGRGKRCSHARFNNEKGQKKIGIA
jgi:hypothetical protein